MIKKIAWNAFKNTGDINSFLEFKQIENIEQNMTNQNNKGWNNQSAKYEVKWNSNIGK